MEEGKLMESMWELGSSMLGGALEPLDAFLWSLGQAEFAIEFCDAEAVQGAGVGRSTSFAVKLDGLCGLATATPAILAAGAGTVSGIGVTMFSCEDEEREGAIKVLAVLVCADAVSVAVGKEVLRGHMPTVGIAFEEGGGLLYEVVAFFDGLFYVYDVSRCGCGNWKSFGGVDHKDGKLELEIRVLSFLSIGTVELKGTLVGQEGRLLPRPEVGMVKDWARRW
jgi:NAD/NADP transhydrogenase beta subunit